MSLFPYRAFQSAEKSSVCCTVGFYPLSGLYVEVYTCPLRSLNLSLLKFVFPNHSFVGIQPDIIWKVPSFCIPFFLLCKNYEPLTPPLPLNFWTSSPASSSTQDPARNSLTFPLFHGSLPPADFDPYISVLFKYFLASYFITSAHFSRHLYTLYCPSLLYFFFHNCISISQFNISPSCIC